MRVKAVRRKFTPNPEKVRDTRPDRTNSRVMTRDEEHIMNAMSCGIKMVKIGDWRVSVSDFLKELDRRGFEVVPHGRGYTPLDNTHDDAPPRRQRRSRKKKTA